jgi:hypothetical protein
MASTSEIHPKNFNDNNSSKVDSLSAILSGVNTGLILTTYTTLSRGAEQWQLNVCIRGVYKTLRDRS